MKKFKLKDWLMVTVLMVSVMFSMHRTHAADQNGLQSETAFSPAQSWVHRK